MDLEQLINDYKQWVLDNPSIYKITYGNPMVTKTAPNTTALGILIGDALASGVPNVTSYRQSNSETLDGLVDWYNYVYLPSQE